MSAVSTTALCYPRADPRVVASASPRLGASRSAVVRKLTPRTQRSVPSSLRSSE